MQDVIVWWRGSWMFPQHGTVWKFIVDFLGNWYISQQHELLHHGVGLPDNQQRLFNFYLHNINPGKVQRKAGGRKLPSEATYKSSFAWRSMGSWVSLSMWKRTSNEDNVRALKGESNTHPFNIQLLYKRENCRGQNKSLIFNSQLWAHPFSILRFLRILANLLRPLKLLVILSFLVLSSILIWASA